MFTKVRAELLAKGIFQGSEKSAKYVLTETRTELASNNEKSILERRSRTNDFQPGCNAREKYGVTI
jgi:hypothetical protein